jgi:hypothetical protein
VTWVRGNVATQVSAAICPANFGPRHGLPAINPQGKAQDARACQGQWQRISIGKMYQSQTFGHIGYHILVGGCCVDRSILIRVQTNKHPSKLCGRGYLLTARIDSKAPYGHLHFTLANALSWLVDNGGLLVVDIALRQRRF